VSPGDSLPRGTNRSWARAFELRAHQQAQNKKATGHRRGMVKRSPESDGPAQICMQPLYCSLPAVASAAQSQTLPRGGKQSGSNLTAQSGAALQAKPVGRAATIDRPTSRQAARPDLGGRFFAVGITPGHADRRLNHQTFLVIAVTAARPETGTDRRTGFGAIIIDTPHCPRLRRTSQQPWRGETPQQEGQTKGNGQHGSLRPFHSGLAGWVAGAGAAGRRASGLG
jgi:hypothetical protein